MKILYPEPVNPLEAPPRRILLSTVRASSGLHLASNPFVFIKFKRSSTPSRGGYSLANQYLSKSAASLGVNLKPFAFGTTELPVTLITPYFDSLRFTFLKPQPFFHGPHGERLNLLLP